MNRIDILKEEAVWLKRDIGITFTPNPFLFIVLTITWSIPVFFIYVISTPIRLLKGY